MLKQKYILLFMFPLLFTSCATIWDFAVLPFSKIDKKKDIIVSNYYPDCECLSFSIDSLYLDSLGSSRNYAINIWKFEHDNYSSSPIQIRMYDGNGCYSGAYEICFGNAKSLGVYREVPINIFKNSNYEVINKKISLAKDVEALNISTIEKQEILNSASNYDYNVVVFWSDFGGYYMKRHLRQVKKYINKNKDDYKFRLIYTFLSNKTTPIN